MHTSHVQRMLIVASALAAVAATRAAADVDVEVPLALKAKGTLLPEGEVETYRFTATKGTLLGFQASVGKGAHLAFAAHLFVEGGAEVSIPPSLLVVTAKKLSVAKLPLTATGAYRLEISAAGTGEYALTLSGKAQAKFAAAPAIAQAGTAPFAFSAPPGSRVTLSAKAARGSGATPRFGALTGVGVNVDLSSMKTIRPTSHTVVLASVGGTGELSVDVVNPGAAGDVTVTATVKPPKVRAFSVDTRAVQRGRPQGGESVVVRAVGASGGTVQVADVGSDLDGASVVFPAGAFSATTNVTMASAPAPQTGADDQVAGPALFCGPWGTTFGAPVEIVLPFDPARIPVDQTPQDLRVLVVEKNGASSIRPPASVDVLGRTVTVEANGFSTFTAIARVGQQPLGVRPGGDQFWLLSVNTKIDPDALDDSRHRHFGLEIGELSFQSGGVVQISTSTREFTIENPTAIDGERLDERLTPYSASISDSTTWSYGADGRTIAVAGGDGPTTLTTSRDGNFMISSGDHTQFKAEAMLLVRKSAATPTPADVAGKYAFVYWSAEAEDQGESGGVQPRSSRLVGVWTFFADGRFSLTGSQRDSALTAVGAPTSVLQSLSVSGTFVVDVAGAVVATIPAQGSDSAQVFRLLPGPEGAVLIGTDKDPRSNGGLHALVLVRQATAAGAATTAGEYRGVEIDTALSPYTVSFMTQPSLVVADLEIAGLDLGMTFSGAGSLTVASSRRSTRRDTSVAGGVRAESATATASVTYQIDRYGRFAVTQPGETSVPVGAVTADGMFGCGVSNVATGDGSNSLLFFVKLPPAK